MSVHLVQQVRFDNPDFRAREPARRRIEARIEDFTLLSRNADRITTGNPAGWIAILIHLRGRRRTGRKDRKGAGLQLIAGLRADNLRSCQQYANYQDYPAEQ